VTTHYGQERVVTIIGIGPHKESRTAVAAMTSIKESSVPATRPHGSIQTGSGWSGGMGSHNAGTASRKDIRPIQEIIPLGGKRRPEHHTDADVSLPKLAAEVIQRPWQVLFHQMRVIRLHSIG
jgi:hypothetical protein